MSSTKLSRREFLRAAGLTSVGLVAAACAPSVAPPVAPTAGTTAVPLPTQSSGPRYGGLLRVAESLDGMPAIGAPPPEPYDE